MKNVHAIGGDVAVVGWSCRLPGANSVDALWSLLIEQRCAVTEIPADRFSLARYGHPRKNERGRSYSWSAGVLDNVWHFDPAVFGVSPREAIQMDPQQRLLLELTWESLEDAGIRPSTLAGKDVGVFVGASQIDYAHSFLGDQAIADSHFATGTALAILANRISYIFDFRGPSVTVDTACSSSLVALHQAVEALRSGRIDTAIVAGTNVITSPASFIAFSQASMLSPTGLCQAFSAKADGFVRAEGGGVVVLRRTPEARKNRNPIHGFVLATDVNSDGRTGGISLPSQQAQQALLERIYVNQNLHPDRLAFVEAHGTGTAAGDPIEATALGRGLGQRRSKQTPLPIGSVKTNIGHLEPGAGIAGLIKALLSLNHRVLPASLHAQELNPNIPFEELNLAVAREPLLLGDTSRQIAGVNSFGFGGTNAHAVVAPGEVALSPAKASTAPFLFMASAEGDEALSDLARRYGAETQDAPPQAVSAAIAHRREHLSSRAVVSARDGDELKEALTALTGGRDHPALIKGSAVGKDLPVAFVYSGNGSQWVGMGVAAHQHNPTFRAHFALIDEKFKKLAGWSLREMLCSEELADKLPETSVAQPLIFAIQSATTAALRKRGVQPVAVLGHSVGEIAAAEAAGILDLDAAVALVYRRSRHQEQVRGKGRMLALRATASAVDELLGDGSDVEIAAINSPNGLTIAGPADRLAAFCVENPGLATVDLDLDYPFHSSQLDPIKEGLIADLAQLRPQAGTIPFISTVTGRQEAGQKLNAQYWWHNVRDPVRFVDAVRAAADLGARFFFEIGARATLTRHILDSLDGEVSGVASETAVDRRDENVDPIERAIMRALAAGMSADLDKTFGKDPGPGVKLPSYPWQHREFRFEHTVEAIGNEPVRHPFAGARQTADGLEWRSDIDTALYPELTGHKLGEQVLFPGTAFLEIAIFVARDWLKTEHVTIANFEILKALDLTKGETREVMTRVSPGSNTIEIFSRPRLSHAAWLQHCRGKMLHGNRSAGTPLPRLDGPANHLTKGQVYQIASGTGLNYGPSFSLVESMAVYDQSVVDVRLAPHGEQGLFVLDPVRTDACSHGTFAVFPELHAKERGVSYIPVRIDQASVYHPHARPSRAIVEIIDKSSRAIFANYFILDDDNQLIALLRGVRCQAVPVRHIATAENIAVVETPKLLDGSIAGEVGVIPSVADVVNVVHTLHQPSPDGKELSAAQLLEGWGMSVAYELAKAFAEAGSLDVDRLVTSGRLSLELRNWFENLCSHLVSAGLLSQRGGHYSLIEDDMMPPSASLVRDLAREHPERGPELLLVGAFSGLAAEAKARGRVNAAPDILNSATTTDFFNSANAFASSGADTLKHLVRRIPDFWPKHRALRILQIGYGPLTHVLRQRSKRGRFDLTILETDRLAYDRASAALGKDAQITLLGADEAGKLSQYDFIVAVDGLHQTAERLPLDRLRSILSPEGMLLALEPTPSLFRDIVFGVRPDWFSGINRASLRSAKEWMSALQEAGYAKYQAEEILMPAEAAILICAKPGPAGRSENASESNVKQPVAIMGQRSFAKQEALARHFLCRNVSLLPNAGPNAFGESPVCVVDLGIDTTNGDRADSLMQRCLALRQTAERLPAKSCLWLVFRNAGGTDDPGNAVERGAWAFSRTLANEFAVLDIRRINIAGAIDPEDVSSAIVSAVLSGTAETELNYSERGMEALRVTPLRSVIERMHRQTPAAARLVRTSGGSRLGWQALERQRPARGEIEIAVEATGLNFRDLMFSLSLLPDEMLEDGFTGPTLGLECAGRITAVGDAVAGFTVGDPVVALAANAFSTHVNVPAKRAAKIPGGMTSEAAATIPVAFLTAYYSLIKLARLQPGETLLIHGGAGAVGLAAIQIAQWKGARVIATAGTPAKRDLLRALGAEYTLDSRSLAFVDEVKAITGDGVDVVLNSLAGEAMEMSVDCLRPFGRFIELGKRDYVGNTHLGLRPFRRNLSYFGVDLDQLVVGQEAVGERLFAEVMRLFAEGVFSGLPHTVFEGANAAEAFHLMQQSSHIGKILVRPASPSLAREEQKPWVAKAGTHVITGAFGGFGAEVARWLCDRGARHLVLVGRKGAASPEATALMAELKNRGVHATAEACDISDARAVEALFAKLHATRPPVVGVMHAAMVLEDAVMMNLTEERFRRVLAPKVTGTENLDRATAGLALDYFVLFSSVTTLIGNPGQGNYVAANAYMEGFAHERRKRGLPALAIGWGPITDVGVVAKSEKLRSNLEKLTGVKGLRARDALELLGQVMALPAKAAEIAAMTISPNDGNFSRERLPVLRSPTYVDFVASAATGEAAADRLDVRHLIESEGADLARKKVADLVARHLAKVLHARTEDISRVRPLGEIGLDSLMALELVMGLEDALGLSISVAGSVGTMTVPMLADEIIAQVELDPDREDAALSDIAGHHVTALAPEQLQGLRDVGGAELKRVEGLRS